MRRNVLVLASLSGSYAVWLALQLAIVLPRVPGREYARTLDSSIVETLVGLAAGLILAVGVWLLASRWPVMAGRVSVAYALLLCLGLAQQVVVFVYAVLASFLSITLLPLTGFLLSVAPWAAPSHNRSRLTRAHHGTQAMGAILHFALLLLALYATVQVAQLCPPDCM